MNAQVNWENAIKERIQRTKNIIKVNNDEIANLEKQRNALPNLSPVSDVGAHDMAHKKDGINRDINSLVFKNDSLENTIINLEKKLNSEYKTSAIIEEILTLQTDLNNDIRFAQEQLNSARKRGSDLNAEINKAKTNLDIIEEFGGDKDAIISELKDLKKDLESTSQDAEKYERRLKVLKIASDPLSAASKDPSLNTPAFRLAELHRRLEEETDQFKTEFKNKWEDLSQTADQKLEEFLDVISELGRLLLLNELRIEELTQVGLIDYGLKDLNIRNLENPKWLIDSVKISRAFYRFRRFE